MHEKEHCHCIYCTFIGFLLTLGFLFLSGTYLVVFTNSNSHEHTTVNGELMFVIWQLQAYLRLAHVVDRNIKVVKQLFTRILWSDFGSGFLSHYHWYIHFCLNQKSSFVSQMVSCNEHIGRALTYADASVIWRQHFYQLCFWCHCLPQSGHRSSQGRYKVNPLVKASTAKYCRPYIHWIQFLNDFYTRAQQTVLYNTCSVDTVETRSKLRKLLCEGVKSNCYFILQLLLKFTKSLSQFDKFCILQFSLITNLFWFCRS